METKNRHEVDILHNTFVTCDLWGTLLIEDHSALLLDDFRASILYSVFSEIGEYLSEEIWLKRIKQERTSFKVIENQGIVLSSNERLKKLTMNRLNERDFCYVKKRFSEAACELVPKINYKLLRILSDIQSQCQGLALISNTGLIDPNTTYDLLRKLDIIQRFDYIFLSEEVGLCKPNPRFFSHAAEKMSTTPENILHIGDSYEKDFIPAIKAGCRAVLYKGNLKDCEE